MIHTLGFVRLMDDTDREMLPWVQLFNKYDLYTKDRPKCDEDEMRQSRTVCIQPSLPPMGKHL